MQNNSLPIIDIKIEQHKNISNHVHVAGDIFIELNHCHIKIRLTFMQLKSNYSQTMKI